VVCETCRPPGSARPAPETLALLGALLEGDWPATRDAAPFMIKQASGLVSAYAIWHLDRNLKSLAHVER
jgi:DNA repair protein RecO (recombination protein O)